jgi:hypothetical protein
MTLSCENIGRTKCDLHCQRRLRSVEGRARSRPSLLETTWFRFQSRTLRMKFHLRRLYIDGGDW